MGTGRQVEQHDVNGLQRTSDDRAGNMSKVGQWQHAVVNGLDRADGHLRWRRHDPSRPASNRRIQLKVGSVYDMTGHADQTTVQSQLPAFRQAQELSTIKSDDRCRGVEWEVSPSGQSWRFVDQFQDIGGHGRRL